MRLWGKIFIRALSAGDCSFSIRGFGRKYLQERELPSIRVEKGYKQYSYVRNALRGEEMIEDYEIDFEKKVVRIDGRDSRVIICDRRSGENVELEGDYVDEIPIKLIMEIAERIALKEFTPRTKIEIVENYQGKLIPIVRGEEK